MPDPAAALAEIGRVLALGGRLHVFEHVRSRHAVFIGVQRVVDSVYWTRALGGCRTTRDTEAASAPYILGVAVRDGAENESDSCYSAGSCAARKSRMSGM